MRISERQSVLRCFVRIAHEIVTCLVSRCVFVPTRATISFPTAPPSCAACERTEIHRNVRGETKAIANIILLVNARP